MNDAVSANQVRTRNARAVIEALRLAGVTSVSVAYSGMGDEGQAEEVTTEPEKEEVLAQTVRVIRQKREYVKSDNRWETRTEEVDGELEEALKEIVCDVLEERHPGWEINEGSRGLFTLTVVDGRFELDHEEWRGECERGSLCV